MWTPKIGKGSQGLKSQPMFSLRSIILQHTGAHAPGTIDALPYLIEVSRALDYEWVSVDELLAEAEDQPTLPSAVTGAARSINQDQTRKEIMP